MKTMLKNTLIMLCTVLSLNVYSVDNEPLSEQIENLKQQAIALNRDLFILEEDLLYPPATQIAFYVAIDASELFTIDSIKLMVDDELATHYLYTEKQVNALAKGGVHRLYQGNVKQGEHQLTAYVIGKGPQGRDIKRAATLTFNKDDEAKAIELVISANSAKEQADFTIREIE
ncbi:MAG: hypothetical protein VX100_09975 [Pseudomonadota bacterium]|nr:hypothetical protein [Pseudomonadota bacterium]